MIRSSAPRWNPLADESVTPQFTSWSAALSTTAGFVQLVVRRFFQQGMTVYAAALAYRGLLALIPLALFILSIIGLFGIEGSLPRLTGLLLRARGRRGDDGATMDVPLEGLLSLGVIIGVWSMSTGARLFMRALNVAHNVEERRSRLARVISAAVFLPALAVSAIAATFLLLITSRIIAWTAGWVGLAPVATSVGSWLRMPIAFMVVAGAIAGAYHFGPSVRPPLRAVVAGAAVAVVLWVGSSLAFSFALSTVLDYGSTYGALGAGVALLVYLHLSAVVLLLGAQISAVLGQNIEVERGGDPLGPPGAGSAGPSTRAMRAAEVDYPRDPL